LQWQSKSCQSGHKCIDDCACNFNFIDVHDCDLTVAIVIAINHINDDYDSNQPETAANSQWQYQ